MTQKSDHKKEATNTRSWERLSPLLLSLIVWASIFAVLYILRPFFLLIFLTFVFAYLQDHVTDILKPFLPNRIARVILVALVLLGIISLLGAIMVPRVKDQTRAFISKVPSYLQRIDYEIVKLPIKYPTINEWFPELSDPSAQGTFEEYQRNWEIKKSTTSKLLQDTMALNEGTSFETVKHTMESVQVFGKGLLAIVSAFLLSLLFSFLIVLDLPRLTREVTNIKKTKLGFGYNEVAPGIYNFATVLGKALEAQLMIALINSILTAIAVHLMGIGDKAAFLTVIVFFCSFIPVAGVFISSLPICLVALQEGGFSLLFISILVIWIIHMVEAYVLNPRIYGHHLHLNPVIVLIILTVCGKLFGVWGLVLGVPIWTYIFGYAIKNPTEKELSDASPG